MRDALRFRRLTGKHLNYPLCLSIYLNVLYIGLHSSDMSCASQFCWWQQRHKEDVYVPSVRLLFHPLSLDSEQWVTTRSCTESPNLRPCLVPVRWASKGFTLTSHCASRMSQTQSGEVLLIQSDLPNYFLEILKMHTHTNTCVRTGACTYRHIRIL